MSDDFLSCSEVDAVLMDKKKTVRAMIWDEKPNITNPKWHQFNTACWVFSEVREDVYFRSQFRYGHFENKHGVTIFVEDSYHAGLYIGNVRVFAIDFHRNMHQNSKGKGLPYYGQRFNGLHRHIWTSEGEGYAEPIDNFGTVDLKAVIDVFCNEANLQILNGFVKPKPEQMSLTI